MPGLFVKPTSSEFCLLLFTQNKLCTEEEERKVRFQIPLLFLWLNTIIARVWKAFLTMIYFQIYNFGVSCFNIKGHLGTSKLPKRNPVRPNRELLIIIELGDLGKKKKKVVFAY